MEEKLCRKVHNVSQRVNCGSTVDDMNHHIVPILWKKPSHLIIHVWTDHASLSTSREILNKLLNLKSIAKDINPDCDVSLSTRTIRTDRGKEGLTVSNLTNHLLQLKINAIDKRNITGKRLGRRDLYLNVSGCNQLAKISWQKIKTFWEGKGCSGTNDNNRRDNPSVFDVISASSSKDSDNQEGGDFNFKECLKNIRQNNLNRPILGQLNINLIRNKFSFLASQIGNNVDVLLISEAKLDHKFLTAQFLLDGFKKSYRLDCCSKGGGLLLFVWGDILSRILTEYKTPTNVECIFIEISIRKKNWLLCCSYNPYKSNISTHMHHLSKGLDIYMNKYDNILFLGDFNSETSENYLNDFCHVYNLRNIVKKPTCFKNPNNPACIDLSLTNRPRCFQNTVAVETGISDFHKMVVAVLKVFYKKQKLKIIQ